MRADDQSLDDVAKEIADLEHEIDRLRFAEPKDDHQASQIQYRREVSERHLRRLRALA
jgi:hypothetical protein